MKIVLDHISFRFITLKEATSILNDVGLPLDTTRPYIPNIPGYWYKVGIAQLHTNGREATQFPNGASSHPNHICIGVEDIDTFVNTLINNGINVTKKGSLDIPQYWIISPNGNLFEIQPLKDRENIQEFVFGHIKLFAKELDSEHIFLQNIFELSGADVQDSVYHFDSTSLILVQSDTAKNAVVTIINSASDRSISISDSAISL